MPFGAEVDLGPGDIVLDGDPPKRGTAPPILAHVLRPNGCMAQDACTWYGGRPRPGHIVLHADPAPPKRGTAVPQFSAHACCGQTAGWIKMPLGMEIDLDPGHIVSDTAQPPPSEGAQQSPPSFRPMSIVVKRSPISATAEQYRTIFLFY